MDYVLVPLAGAHRQDQQLHLSYTAAQIEAAPAVGDVDALVPDDEDALLAYYAHLNEATDLG